MDKIDTLFHASYINLLLLNSFLISVRIGFGETCYRRPGPTVLSSQSVQQVLMQRTSWTRTKLMRLSVSPTDKDMDDQLEECFFLVCHVEIKDICRIKLYVYFPCLPSNFGPMLQYSAVALKICGHQVRF